MAPVCAVVVAGGSGQRFGNPGGKQLVNVAGRPLMSWSIRAFDRSEKVGHIVVVCPAERRTEMRRLAINPFDYDTPISFADAGDTRQDSTRAGVHAVPAGFEYVAIHDGARPLITTEAIDHAIDVLVGDRSLDGVVCGQPAIDTLKIVDGDNIVETPPRELYWAAQTPQIFSVDAMKRAHAAAIAEGFIGTDDSSLVERMGGRVRCVQSPRDNLKVTVPEDLRPVTAILLGRMAEGEDLPHVQYLRIGHGYDVHRLVEGRRCIIGGVDIPYERGLLGHSDADVLAHALADAILGACRGGDIGKLFPDTDPAYEGADSMVLLARVMDYARELGFEFVDADCTIACQQPKITPHRDAMRANLAHALGVDVENVGVAATTTEKLGWEGQGEGIGAWAVCLLQKTVKE